MNYEQELTKKEKCVKRHKRRKRKNITIKKNSWVHSAKGQEK